jgi:hypothetical protein
LHVQWKSGPWRTVISWLGVIAVGVAAVLAVIALLGPITDLIARHDVSTLPRPERAAHLQAARETARTQLLTLGAGIFVAGALWFTARNFFLSREGQVTDRYTKAIEQLGSDRLDVRIGGIYALERVARDSVRDHPTVMEVLAAFVREHSREIWPPEASDEPRADAPVRTTRPDVQAAVTVIGRRNSQYDRQPVNLDASNLTRANLTDARLIGTNLNRANFTGAHLTGANLTGVQLIGANFSSAWLTGANLTRAYLGGAILSDANLTDANLTEARLTAVPLFPSTTRTLVIGVGATLSGANLTRAILIRADLTSADLNRANFTGAHLTGALWPPNAVVPDGWQRDADSGGLKRADTNSSGTATN